MKNILPKQVYIGCTISVLLVILVGFLSLYTTATQERKEHRIEQSYLALGQLEYIQSLMSDMETGRRGFRATADRRFMEPYVAAQSEIGAALRELRNLIGMEPAQQAGLKRVEAEVMGLVNFWKNLTPVADLEDHKQVLLITATEKSKMDALRKSIADLKVEERKVLSDLKVSDQGLRERTAIAISTGTVLILVLVSFLVFLVIREFKNRVSAFQKEHEISEQKSAFVSLASHEFRTPLSSIQLSASLIRKYANQGSVNVEKILNHSDKIQNSVGHLTTILNDFLSLERLEAGKIKPVFEDFDLVDVCKEIKQEMELMAKPGQTILYRHSGFDTGVNLDKNLIKNCLINLISNAIKYSGDETTISFNTVVDRDFVNITVKDNGIGIPDKEQKSLFQPFYRAGNTGNIPGTGLGLNIVLRYVQLMNGHMTFESELNKGSTFTITFTSPKSQSTEELVGENVIPARQAEVVAGGKYGIAAGAKGG